MEDSSDSSENYIDALREINIESASGCNHLLGSQHLHLGVDLLPWILRRIDCFVIQSRGNKTVEYLILNPHVSSGRHGDEACEKLGQAIGNLQSLKKILICTDICQDEDDEEVLTPNWEIVARMLTHVRQKVTLKSSPSSFWCAEDFRSLARVIRGHPTITHFQDDSSFPNEASDALYSALATLPALKSVKLYAPPDNEMTLANPESLTELLRVPSLRSVFLRGFYFTSALCQATANALIEGTEMIDLDFTNCSLPAGECAAILANGLSRNTSVAKILVASRFDEALNGALAEALLSNSTLQELDFEVFPFDDNPRAVVDWSPIFLALGKNTGLQTLSLDMYNSMDESLCAAIKDGLSTNTTIQQLKLKSVDLYDDITAPLWRRAFASLRTHKFLQCLTICATESFYSTLRSDIVCMLQENASLVSLSILNWHNAKAEDYIALIAALQHNTTLATLIFRPCKFKLTGDDDKLIVKMLKKNYALETLPEMQNRQDASAILRLNAAGRRYLIEDGSSVSKGVEVLSAVCSDVNCVFLHLLENPRLCDRSVVESASDGTDNGGSTNVTNPSGKREKDQELEEGKASRRRRT
jgi:hypothetical protein